MRYTAIQRIHIGQEVVPHDDGVSFFIHTGEREFLYLLRLVGAGNLCIMTVNAEPCVVDDRKYFRMHSNQHLHPKAKVGFLNNFAVPTNSRSEFLERINPNSKIAVELER